MVIFNYCTMARLVINDMPTGTFPQTTEHILNHAALEFSFSMILDEKLKRVISCGNCFKLKCLCLHIYQNAKPSPSPVTQYSFPVVQHLSRSVRVPPLGESTTLLSLCPNWAYRTGPPQTGIYL